MINIEWVEVTPNEWEATHEGYELQAYRPLHSTVVYFAVVSPDGDVVVERPMKTTLGTAKRATTRWLSKHLGEQPESEQAQALTLADELERLQAMEKRLREYVSELELAFDTDSSIQALHGVLYGEALPNE